MSKVIKTLKIKGAKQHNLKNIDVDIPLESIVVITGVSGSGKSSLAIDCIYKESKYRYLDALGLTPEDVAQSIERPEVSSIENLPPAITLSYEGLLLKKPYLTAASLAGILDEIRTLWAYCGYIKCPKCGRIITSLSIDQMANEILMLDKNSKIILLAPLPPKNSTKDSLRYLLKNGFSRIRLNDEIILTQDALAKSIPQNSKLEIVIDRLILKEGIEKRLLDSLRLALLKGNGCVRILQLTPTQQSFEFCEELICPTCNINFSKPYPEMFSPFSKIGSCPKCHGKSFINQTPCNACNGTGLSSTARSVYLWGLTIADILSLNFKELQALLISFLNNDLSKLLKLNPSIIPKIDINLAPNPKKLAMHIVDVLLKKIDNIIQMGLGYIKLGQNQPRLAAGEIRKLSLIATLSKSLTGILYIMDEPALGLHNKEIEKLIINLKKLKESGNSIILIEHNLDVISNADFIIDMGPSAGEKGGRIIAIGTPKEIKNNPNSVTAPFLSKKQISIIRERQKLTNFIEIKSIKLSPINKKDIHITIPFNAITCIHGISGSGKTLLLKAIKENLNMSNVVSEYKIVCLDQTELVKSSLSMPVTYIKIYDQIRRLYARVPEARQRGLKASHFSLSKKGGRCERCKGLGYLTIELKHLPSVKLRCDVCFGKRFSKEVLSVKYRGLSITECLELSVDHAIKIFSRIPAIRDPLMILKQVGLGYLKLGQSASSLSGGEAQRLRLARELLNKNKGIYLLDEPFRGLHPLDQEKIIKVLDRLVQAGNTIIMAENSKRAILNSDWLIEMGPGAGPEGGDIIYIGKPNDLL